jgi:putative transposase
VVETAYGVSERRVCGVLRFPRSSHRYRTTRDGQAALRLRLKELAAARVRYGYRRLHILLWREGWRVNAKRVYRLYCEENLQMRTHTPRRRVSCRTRGECPAAERINDCWAMDFMNDELFDGRRFRVLTVVDHFSRESVALEAGQRFDGRDVVRVLTRVGAERGLPKTIRVDNGSEFTSKVLDQWVYANGVTLDFSRPGKPTDNALIESFNGRLRQECLNENWFLSLADAIEKLAAWRKDYNDHRPHSALGNLAPSEFASTCQVNPAG